MAIPPVPGFDHLWTFSVPSPEETRRSLALQPFAFLLQPFLQPASNPGIFALNPAGAPSPVSARKAFNRHSLDLRALA